MGLDARKPVFGGLQTTKAQTDQRLCYSLIGKYRILTCYKQFFNFLASLNSWGDWFKSRFVGNPEDRFCRAAAQLYHLIIIMNFPIGILGQVWYSIVSIPDLCTLTY